MWVVLCEGRGGLERERVCAHLLGREAALRMASKMQRQSEFKGMRLWVAPDWIKRAPYRRATYVEDLASC